LSELRQLIGKSSLGVLDDAQLQRLAQASEKRGFVVKGSVWGEPRMQGAVLLVSQGRFRVQLQTRDVARQVLSRFARQGSLIGGARIVREAQPPDVFGDVRPAHELPRAIVMPSGLLSAYFEESRAFARALLREIQDAADALAEEVVALRCDPFIERALARIGRELGQNSGELDWSQDDLAQLVGGTRFEVSRELGRLAPFLGWQGRRGKLIVRDLLEARRLIAYRRELAGDVELHRYC
jgi:CRP-like cAMP-binding protein